MKTYYGLEFQTLTADELDKFQGYDRGVAQCHLANCGFIIVYAAHPSEPIDNEYDLDVIYDILKN